MQRLVPFVDQHGSVLGFIRQKTIRFTRSDLKVV